MIHRFHEPIGEGMVEDVGAGVELLHLVDGRILVRHECGRWPDDREEDGVFVKVVAPALSGGHAVEARIPTTVSPSILCPDCGLHGYVRAGRWAAA